MSWFLEVKGTLTAMSYWRHHAEEHAHNCLSRYYVAPDGALGFTQAHSASYPVGSMFGVSAYQDGAFTYGGRAWVACPEDAGSGFKVFAQLPGLSFSEDCIPFTALVKSAPRGTFGAWQYT